MTSSLSKFLHMELTHRVIKHSMGFHHGFSSCLFILYALLQVDTLRVFGQALSLSVPADIYPSRMLADKPSECINLSKGFRDAIS